MRQKYNTSRIHDTRISLVERKQSWRNDTRATMQKAEIARHAIDNGQYGAMISANAALSYGCVLYVPAGHYFMKRAACAVHATNDSDAFCRVLLGKSLITYIVADKVNGNALGASLHQQRESAEVIVIIILLLCQISRKRCPLMEVNINCCHAMRQCTMHARLSDER